MTFWEKWLEWWTSVSAQWNSIDAKVQSGDIVLNEAQQAQYDAINAAFGEVDADDLAEMYAAGKADELASALLETTTGLVSSAFDWIDSLF